MKTRGLILGAAVAALVVAGLLPVLAVFIESVTTGGRLGVEAYGRVFASGRPWALMMRTVGLAGATTLVTLVAGVPLGVILGKTDVPLRTSLIGLFTVPFLLPPYVLAVGWADLLAPEGAAGYLLGHGLARTLSDALDGFPGCVLVLASAFVPVVLILTIASLRTVNPWLEEAGRLVAAWPAVLRRVSLPLARPGLALAAMLVFLLVTGEFGVPLFLRYDVFAVESFTQFSAFFDYGASAAAALPLVALAATLPALERRLRHGRTSEFRAATGERLTIALHRWRLPVLLAACIAAALLAVPPLGGLLVQAGSVEAFRQALHLGGASLIRSLLYASAGASALTAIGFLLGYLLHTRALRAWRSVDSLMLLLFALPGSVLGIGLAAVWNRGWAGLVYATPAIVVIGYVAQYAAVPSRIAAAALARVPASLEEAAQTLGVGWLRRMIFIVVPLARWGVLGAWLVSFLFCLRDLGITMLVYPAGRDTLPVRTFTQMANGVPSTVAALCLLLAGVAIVLLLALGAVGRRLRGAT